LPSHVVEARVRMPVLDPEPLDRLGRPLARLRELLAHAFAERCCERMDLADGRLCHPDMEPEKVSRVGDDSVPTFKRPRTLENAVPPDGGR